jgi:hypothetical protein
MPRNRVLESIRREERRLDRYLYHRRSVGQFSRALSKAFLQFDDTLQGGVSVHDIPFLAQSEAPEWASDTTKLRAVILEMERRHNKAVPKPRALVQFAKNQESVERAGSYRAYVAALLYRSWRLGENSVEVARQLAIKAVVVRVQLCRARRIGEELFDPVAAEIRRIERRNANAVGNV